MCAKVLFTNLEVVQFGSAKLIHVTNTTHGMFISIFIECVLDVQFIDLTKRL